MVRTLEGSRTAVVGLVATLAANAAFDAVALYPVAEATVWGRRAKQWAKDDLDRLEFPESFRFVFPIVKGSSVAGLLIGLRWRKLGRFTAGSVLAYFITAIGFHVRVKDPALKYAPAVGMLGWSALAFRSLKGDRG